MVGGGQTHIFLTTSHLRGTYIDSWHTISMWVMICEDIYVSHDSLIPSCESDFLMRVWFPYESLIPLWESDSLIWVWFPYVSLIPLRESWYVSLIPSTNQLYSRWINICDFETPWSLSHDSYTTSMSCIDVCDSKSERLNRYMWLTYVMPIQSLEVTYVMNRCMWLGVWGTE